MIGKVGIVALIAGIVVLAGNYISGLQQYYLVPIGGILAIVAAILDNISN